jgi:hypothetical protein
LIRPLPNCPNRDRQNNSEQERVSFRIGLVFESQPSFQAETADKKRTNFERSRTVRTSAKEN